jgi:capsular exopolysaccharide synthesis family protein
LIVLSNPGSAASEAYRALRTNLLYLSADNPPTVIVVSSSRPREGKSTICANLAVALAQAEKDVLLIDGVLQKPMLHEFFALQNIRGLTSVLMKECGPEDAWYEPVPKLKVLTAGPEAHNSADLLDSERFVEFMHLARESFDYVLVDAPPVDLVSDTAILAAHSDGVLLVIDAKKTRKKSVRQSVRSLGVVGVDVLGTVMTNYKQRGGLQRRLS